MTDILDPAGIVFFGDCYLPGMTDDERRAPEISPAFADLSNLPPALMSVGSADHLLDDTLMLASRWAAAGNEVELFVAPDMPHGFGAYACGITTRGRRARARGSTTSSPGLRAPTAPPDQLIARRSAWFALSGSSVRGSAISATVGPTRSASGASASRSKL